MEESGHADVRLGGRVGGAMVGLVLVSHSYEIGEGVRMLAQQMTQEPVGIVAVGGIREEDGSYSIGTDTERIREAILSLAGSSGNADEGVLLLVDLGSAVMCAETAVELIPAEVQAKCLISNAPLVEGAVVAAVEASLGHSLIEVNRAAEDALRLVKVMR